MEKKNFDEEFERIYQEIYNNCNEKLNEVRKKNNKFVLVVLMIGIFANIITYFVVEMKSIVTVTIAATGCLILLLIINGREIYKKFYKTNVIQELVKAYNPKLYYDSKMGVSKYDYTASNFDNNFNEFYSEDQIYGTLEDGTKLRIAEVATAVVQKVKDADGNVKENRTETYRGMYGSIRLPYNITSSIYIANDSIIKRYSNDRVEVDSAEFEKYYDCMTKDKVMALRILTSDLIEKFNEIRRDSKYGFELKIEDSMVFFRYKCGQIFEPPTFSVGLDKSLIRKYYRYVFYPIEIITQISKNVTYVVKE